MKKAITILAVLIVLVGAVFADAPVGETQRITITSVVERVDPQYLLKGVLGASAANFTTEAEVVDGGSHNGEQIDSRKDISQEAIVASFGVFQVEDAKNRFAYTFTISATKLVQTLNAAEVPSAPENPYTTAHTPVFSGLGGDWYDADDTGIASASKAYTQTLDVNTQENVNTGVTASVTFDGLAKINKDTTNPKLTFTVTWADDQNAPAGTYMADVTMAYTVV